MNPHQIVSVQFEKLSHTIEVRGRNGKIRFPSALIHGMQIVITQKGGHINREALVSQIIQIAIDAVTRPRREGCESRQRQYTDHGIGSFNLQKMPKDEMACGD